MRFQDVHRKAIPNKPTHLPRSHHFFSCLCICISYLLLFNPPATRQPDLEKDVLLHTNQFRKTNGKAPLVIKNELSVLAQKHSEEMAAGKCDFGHNGFSQRFARARTIFGASMAGENVAYGSKTGQEAVQQWIDSPGHRSTMLGDYLYIGIGIARDAAGRIFFTQLFIR